MNPSQGTKAPHALGTGPLLRCVALLFLASVSSFIGAGLLLASI
jgi:hypothetical protein